MLLEGPLQSSDRPQSNGQSRLLPAADGQPDCEFLRHRAGHRYVATAELLTATYRILFESRGEFWGLKGAKVPRALEGADA